MNVYPNIRCTTCNGQVYKEDGEFICLLCARVQKGVRVYASQQTTKEKPRSFAPTGN